MTYIPTLLIVDDDAELRELLRTLLAGDGYRIEMADRGEQALKRAAEVLPDLILLDVMMPGMDGFEACRRLRSDAMVADVPIIMVTALNDRSSRLMELRLAQMISSTNPLTKSRCALECARSCA